MNSNLISLIIPCYNVEKYIDDFLASIEKLNFINKEFIFVDDGSTDKTLKHIQKFANNRTDTKIIHQTNKGVSCARNIGLEKSKGQYICFVDPDDYLNSDYLKILYAAICENNSDTVICKHGLFVNKIKYINKAQKKVYYKTFEGRDLLVSQFLSSKIFNYAPWNKIYKKQILKKFPSYPKVFIEDCYFLEDVPFGTEYMSYCNKVTVIKNKLYFYRQSFSSVSHNKFHLKKLSALKAHDYYKTLDSHNFPESQNYIKTKYCIDNLELLFRARKSKELTKEQVNTMYENYKNNLKFCIKSKKCQWYRKYLMFLGKPFIYFIYKKLLKNSK